MLPCYFISCTRCHSTVARRLDRKIENAATERWASLSPHVFRTGVATTFGKELLPINRCGLHHGRCVDLKDQPQPFVLVRYELLVPNDVLHRGRVPLAGEQFSVESMLDDRGAERANLGGNVLDSHHLERAAVLAAWRNDVFRAAAPFLASHKRPCIERNGRTELRDRIIPL